jgi:two-component system, OmpR family, KDP operon response regulator KdpE
VGRRAYKGEVKRILMVDDEPPFLRALGISLRARDYDVELASTAEKGLALAADRHPDLVILDLGLPSMDGLTMLRRLREWSAVPVLVLTARSDVRDAIEALDAGADDFLAKPFAIGELLARARALLRRRSPERAPRDVDTADFHLDLDACTATVGDRAIHLTATEWRVLDLLVRNEGRVVSQDELLREVWGPGFTCEHDYVRVFVATLRRKLEPVPSQPRYLVTARGLGYRFTSEPEPLPAVSAR